MGGCTIYFRKFHTSQALLSRESLANPIPIVPMNEASDWEFLGKKFFGQKSNLILAHKILVYIKHCESLSEPKSTITYTITYTYTTIYYTST